MTDKMTRMNLIKLFGLGMKYANAGVTGDDFFYSTIVYDLFDNGDDAATVEQIMKRLDNINCSYIDEKVQTSRIASAVKRNNEVIELLQSKLPELNIIGE